MKFQAVPDKHGLILHAGSMAPAICDVLEHQVLREDVVGVRLDYNSLRELNKLGIDTHGMDPMLHYYDWPKLYGRYNPMPHQRTTAAFVVANFRAFILNQQRTGKTASMIWAMDYLRRAGADIGSVLILSTLSTMRTVWVDEINGIIPSASATAVHSYSAAKRKELLAEDYDFFVMNHDGIKVCHNELLSMLDSGRVKTIIVDEGTEFADHTTSKYTVLSQLAERAQRLYWLTATPMSRGPDKVWGQARLIDQSSMPEQYREWRFRTMHQVTKYKWRAKPESKEMCFAAMHPAIRFKKRDVLTDLPPLTHQNLDVELSAQQRKAIAQLKAEGATMVDGEVITAANAAIQVGKILQVCGGVVKDDEGEKIQVACKARWDTLFSLIEGTENKVIVFGSYHGVVDMLHKRLDKLYGAVRVDGRVTGKRRDNVLYKFVNDPATRILVAHPKVVSHGLEFSVADTTVWWTPHPSAEIVAQANERMASGAQKNPMGIYYLTSHFVETAAHKTVRDGLSLQERTLSMYKQFLGVSDGAGPR